MNYLYAIEQVPMTKEFIDGKIDALYIKIGVSDDPAARVKQLQVGSPHLLGLYAIRPVFGNREEFEKAIHAQFKEHRRHGEWFLRHDEIMKWIDTNMASSDLLNESPEFILIHIGEKRVKRCEKCKMISDFRLSDFVLENK